MDTRVPGYRRFQKGWTMPFRLIRTPLPKFDQFRCCWYHFYQYHGTSATTTSIDRNADQLSSITISNATVSTP
eukprot:1420610-Rhodomonas_salina.1